MPDQFNLREKAREAIRSRKLPSRPPDGAFGGPAVGESCAVCGNTIPKDQIEFEIECNRARASQGPYDTPFPPRCFAAWELVRIR